MHASEAVRSLIDRDDVPIETLIEMTSFILMKDDADSISSARRTGSQPNALESCILNSSTLIDWSRSVIVSPGGTGPSTSVGIDGKDREPCMLFSPARVCPAASSAAFHVGQLIRIGLVQATSGHPSPFAERTQSPTVVVESTDRATALDRPKGYVQEVPSLLWQNGDEETGRMGGEFLALTRPREECSRRSRRVCRRTGCSSTRVPPCKGEFAWSLREFSRPGWMR